MSKSRRSHEPLEQPSRAHLIHAEVRPIASLSPAHRNPRTHSTAQVRQIAESIQFFGFTNPILIDEKGQILAGHGRVQAAKLLGLETVPTLRLDHLSDAQKRAYVLADNKLAENAGWDKDLLALEFKYLSELEMEFDLSLTGFETAEIDLLIEGIKPTQEDSRANVIPSIDPSVPSVSRIGDLWLLGSHRLLCGDAQQPDSFRQLMEGQQAQMVFIDPPYNLPIAGYVGGLGAIQHQDFWMASGEMSEAEFTAFLGTVFHHLIAHSQNGSIHYVCMDWRHLYELLTAARSAYSEIKNLCIWNKDNGGMGTFYRSKHELVLVVKHGTESHINNFELGQHGRYRSNVWDYAGVNSFREGRLEELALHPTTKPVALIADAMKDCSHRGGLIVDAFLGSGSTLIAGEQTGRRVAAMELDPRFVDTAIQRWQDYTGKKVSHATTGRLFSQMRSERGHGE